LEARLRSIEKERDELLILVDELKLYMLQQQKDADSKLQSYLQQKNGLAAKQLQEITILDVGRAHARFGKWFFVASHKAIPIWIGSNYMLCVATGGIANDFAVYFYFPSLHMLQGFQDDDSKTIPHDKTVATGIKWATGRLWYIILCC
jgi:hypothetical protein